MKHIAILHHPASEQAADLAMLCSSEFAKRGVQSSVANVWSSAAEEAVARAELVVCIGGDGTVLRAAQLTMDRGIPILGVNMGSLGFLTELAPDDFLSKLDDIVAGEFRTEERMMVDGHATIPDRPPVEVVGLNDIVVSRRQVARPINVELRIDDAMVAEYRCDGMIVATPTGSTGYSLSAGGPILAPSEHHLVVTPVSPHLALSRSLVLQPDSQVELIITSDHGAVMSADGQGDADLPGGTSIRISVREKAAVFARFRAASDFYAELAAKLENQMSSAKKRT